MTPLLRSVSALALLLLAPAALAQADSDGDGISNERELGGYVFNITTGAIDACAPATDAPCFVTDPLAWSSDGDPYSDFQEASGVNMDATVAVPYNSPLVAAYPVIEVVLNQYSFTSNATITDATGRTLSSGSSFTSSVESTTSTSVTAGVSAGTDGLSSSLEATASYSETVGFSEATTSGQELDWESATSTDLDDAGTLSLSLFARNTGGATALNVRPTFNVYIGDDLVATVLPDAPFRASLAPNESSAPVVPVTGGAPLAVRLTFDRLQALQTGAPVTIEVVDILADIQRWRPEDSNWACGTGETCTWTSFQNQILPRTLRLLVDFGYSGDPDADIPFQFRGNPYEYRIYTGSPSTAPGFTLRDVLEIAAFDVVPTGDGVTVEGRPYPGAWVLAEQPDVGGFRPIEQEWIAAGRPQNLLGVVMPRQATLFMTSPDPLHRGAAIRNASVTRDLLQIRARATPRGGLPITSAEAHVVQNGGTVTVPLVLEPNGAYWTTEGNGVRLDDAIGLSSSRVAFTDVLGNVEQSDGLALPLSVATTCSEVPAEDLQGGDGSGGRAVLFPTGDLDRPVEVYCQLGSSQTRYWVPRGPLPGNATLGGVAVLDDGTTLGSASGRLFRSADLGRTWAQVAHSGTFWGGWGIGHRPGTNTVVSFGRASEQSFRASRSTDGGQTWAQISISTSMSVHSVRHLSGDDWIAVGGDGAISTPAIWRSSDDARTWTQVPTSTVRVRGPSGMAFRDETVGIVTDFGEGAGGSLGRVVRTLDGGQTWGEVLAQTRMTDVTYAGNDTWYALRGNFFAPTDATLYKSTQNGDPGTWQAIDLNAFGAVYPRQIAFVSPTEGYVADYAGMLKTTDGGATWTFEPWFSDRFPRTLTVYDDSRALVTGGTSSAPVLALTTSGGDGTVMRNVAAEPGAPAEPGARIDLAPNVPNPFRGRTELTFTLDSADDVTLAVYDLLGREVARLVDAPHAAGEHRVAFDARGLAAGVYLARLTAGGAVATRQMTLLR